MCKVSDKIKFCTCAAADVYSLKHYWVLHRFVKSKNDMVIGEAMMPHYLEKDIENYNMDLLLKRVNEKDAFDIDLEPRPKDRLEVTFSCKGYPLTYGFGFKKGKWKPEQYDPTEWMWHHDKTLMGKIESPLTDEPILEKELKNI